MTDEEIKAVEERSDNWVEGYGVCAKSDIADLIMALREARAAAQKWRDGTLNHDGPTMKQMKIELDEARADRSNTSRALDRMRAERDEARAEMERLQGEVAHGATGEPRKIGTGSGDDMREKTEPTTREVSGCGELRPVTKESKALDAARQEGREEVLNLLPAPGMNLGSHSDGSVFHFWAEIPGGWRYVGSRPVTLKGDGS